MFKPIKLAPVLYADTDATGIMYFGSATRFIEQSVHQIFHLIYGGLNQSSEDYQLMWVMRKVNLSYIQPCFFNDEVSVQVNHVNVRKFMIHFYFSFLNQRGEVCFKSECIMACVSKTSHQPLAIPGEISEYIHQHNNAA